MINPDFQKLLKNWVAVGWLRALDGAFAEFLKTLHPDTPEMVLLMAALTSHQLGRGHICLDLEAMILEPEKSLSLPPETSANESLCVEPPAVLKDIALPELLNHLGTSPFVSPGPGNTPLVLSSGLLYLRRYWEYTQVVGQNILERLNLAFPVPAPDDLKGRIDAIFEPLRNEEEKTKTEVHWQSVAAAVAAKGPFTVISGGPGTGKTTTVVHLLALLQQMAMENGQKLRIRMAAPTGKAAARLTESMGNAMDKLPRAIRETLPREITTLHRLLGSRPDTRHFNHDFQNPIHVDLLVVDEASMIDLEIMAALLSALPKTARLVLLGDKDQLASVEAGAVLGDICQNGNGAGYTSETTAWIQKQTGYNLGAFEGKGTPLDQHIILLRKNYRFGKASGIGALAKAVNKGDPKAVEDIWHMAFTDICHLSMNSIDDECFSHLILEGHCRPKDMQTAQGAVANPQSAFHNTHSAMGYGAYLERVKSGPEKGSEDLWLRSVIEDFSAFQILSPLRGGLWGVRGLNEKTAEILFRHGLITAREGWYAGRPIMITRNDYNLGLMNGDTGIVLPVSDDNSPDGITLKAVFPVANGVLKKVLPSRLNHIETAYAMTVHKSQGSEFDHTALVLPNHTTPVLTRELMYTAVTRSRRWFTLVNPRRDLFAEAVKRRTYRASGLGRLLGAVDDL
ncbi:MAG: exodeoxyribonuclease V subunit alpha [Deltaproteobacteria bacterium]|nr:exodeoxyribonuclease V subunit alpha [Deltaproteobacteria bacterium]